MEDRRRVMSSFGNKAKTKGVKNGVIQDDWETIGKACAKGVDFVKRHYKLGDTKKVQIPGDVELAYEIIGFGVQPKANGRGMAAISWFPKKIC